MPSCRCGLPGPLPVNILGNARTGAKAPPCQGISLMPAPQLVCMARRIEIGKFIVKYLEHLLRLSAKIGIKIAQQVFVGAQPSVCPLHVLDGWLDVKDPCNHFVFKWAD